MSLVLLSGLQIYKYRILKKILTPIYFNKELRCTLCNQIKQHFKKMIFICYNYHCFDKKYDDVIVICPKCLEKEKKKFPLLYINLSQLLFFLKTLWDRKFYQEGIQKTQLIKALTQKKIKQCNFNQNIATEMLKYIQMKLYGYYNIEKQQSIKKYYKEHRKISQLLQSLAYEIKQTYIGQYFINKYRLNHLIFNNQFVKMFSVYVAREKQYKLQIMEEMQIIINQTKLLENLSSYLYKLLKGLDNFQKAFHKNKHNEQLVIFSMNRASIQYRQLHLNQDNQKFQSQLIRTQIYFAGRPIVFKVSTNQQFDFVQVGMILIPKKQSDKIKHYPASLYRFMIYPRGQLENQTYIDDQDIYQQPTKAEFKEKLKATQQPHLRIFQNASQLFKCKRLNNSQQLYEIQTEDQLILNFNTTTFSIENKTTRTLIVEERLKNTDYSVNYYIYPCVRLIGNKVIIENEGFCNGL